MAFKIRQNAFPAGLRPPRWGAYDALPDPLVGWGGDTPAGEGTASPYHTPLGVFGASILPPSALIATRRLDLGGGAMPPTIFL